MFDFANMQWYEIFANIILLLNTVTLLVAPLLKKKGHVCLAICLANAIFVLAFALLGAWAGVAFSAFFCVISIMNYLFGRYNKKVPIYVVGILILASVGLFLLLFFLEIANQWYNAMPMIASFNIIGMIPFKNMLAIRLFLFGNNASWLVYSIGIAAIGNIVQNVILVVNSIGAIVYYHLLPRWKKKSADETQENPNGEELQDVNEVINDKS